LAAAVQDHFMNADQQHLIRKTFQNVERAPVVAALSFYRRLFELAPRLRPLFKNDIEQQATKLMDMLTLSLSLLEKPERLTAELEDLGARHVGYGVQEAHYAIVGQALLDMLADVLGAELTSEARAAWTEHYEFMAAAMLRWARAAVPSPFP
jgi:hemoglobin-like flavoprotein